MVGAELAHYLRLLLSSTRIIFAGYFPKVLSNYTVSGYILVDIQVLPLHCITQVADKRHGYVPDLRSLPHFRDMDEQTFKSHITHRVTGETMTEGFLPQLYDPQKGGGVLGRGVPGIVWHRCVRSCMAAAVIYSTHCLD